MRCAMTLAVEFIIMYDILCSTDYILLYNVTMSCFYGSYHKAYC